MNRVISSTTSAKIKTRPCQVPSDTVQSRDKGDKSAMSDLPQELGMTAVNSSTTYFLSGFSDTQQSNVNFLARPQRTKHRG